VRGGVPRTVSLPPGRSVASLMRLRASACVYESLSCVSVVFWCVRGGEGGARARVGARGASGDASRGERAPQRRARLFMCGGECVDRETRAGVIGTAPRGRVRGRVAGVALGCTVILFLYRSFAS
jgi:hypothetical protein